MVKASNLGSARIGRKRELKKALESYWKGQTELKDLQKTAKELRKTNWELQQASGIDLIPSNDFSYYDITLDTSLMFGAVPERYNNFWDGKNLTEELYFAVARGSQKTTSDGKKQDVVAAEMTKWFDTNYHYIVPEFKADQDFDLLSKKPVEEYLEAKELGIETRPVILGPISFLLLGKTTDNSPAINLLNKLIPVYKELIAELKAAGVKWIQFDEPCLVTDLDSDTLKLYQNTYQTLKNASNDIQLLLATYFDTLGASLKTTLELPVDAIHIDFVRGRKEFDQILDQFPENKILSLGLVDGRNIWRNDLSDSCQLAEQAANKLGKDKIWISPSCSLLFSPYDLDLETKLDPELKSWLAFGKQKLAEISNITKGIREGTDSIANEIAESDAAKESKAKSPKTSNPEVQARINGLNPEDFERTSPYKIRETAQSEKFNFPLFPTTTIGSFPQTQSVRMERVKFRKGDITEEAYNKFLQDETKKCVEWQESVGIDVLVHGEFERTDMVEYFGEKLEGFAFTQYGWVQSYGSRCVKPPILFGDVSRPEPMTVDWAKYAQSLTSKPLKGMLTGPVTILQWSFVRNDQPRSVSCQQIALALRDEVKDLENAGIAIIQIDEPALREGLPLKKADQEKYLEWSVGCFKLAAACVEDSSQIHTHMCYADFNDIIDSIAALDADVISIETSRSQMELLEAFNNYDYQAQIGPGVYDIHSPRTPSVEEMLNLVEEAQNNLSDQQLWINPDCGLKTRGWEEVKSSLVNMVEVAKQLRARTKSEQSSLQSEATL